MKLGKLPSIVGPGREFTSLCFPVSMSHLGAPLFSVMKSKLAFLGLKQRLQECAQKEPKMPDRSLKLLKSTFQKGFGRRKEKENNPPYCFGD